MKKHSYLTASLLCTLMCTISQPAKAHDNIYDVLLPVAHVGTWIGILLGATYQLYSNNYKNYKRYLEDDLNAHEAPAEQAQRFKSLLREKYHDYSMYVKNRELDPRSEEEREEVIAFLNNFTGNKPLQVLDRMQLVGGQAFGNDTIFIDEPYLDFLLLAGNINCAELTKKKFVVLVTELTKFEQEEINAQRDDFIVLSAPTPEQERNLNKMKKFVFAHEARHVANKDVRSLVAASAIAYPLGALTFYLLKALWNSIQAEKSERKTRVQNDSINPLVPAVHIWTSAILSQYFLAKYSQYIERRADREAIEELGRSGAQGCIFFCNAIERTTTPFQRFFDFGHPSISSRRQAALNYLEQWKPRGAPAV